MTVPPTAAEVDQATHLYRLQRAAAQAQAAEAEARCRAAYLARYTCRVCGTVDETVEQVEPLLPARRTVTAGIAPAATAAQAATHLAELVCPPCAATLAGRLAGRWAADRLDGDRSRAQAADAYLDRIW